MQVCGCGYQATILLASHHELVWRTDGKPAWRPESPAHTRYITILWDLYHAQVAWQVEQQLIAGSRIDAR